MDNERYGFFDSVLSHSAQNDSQMGKALKFPLSS